MRLADTGFQEAPGRARAGERRRRGAGQVTRTAKALTAAAAAAAAIGGAVAAYAAGRLHGDHRRRHARAVDRLSERLARTSGRLEADEKMAKQSAEADEIEDQDG